jgi:pimeloyl-ACP methyl ester carboxylesterase
MTTYVLVGGAWIGAWAWRDVAQELRSHGHTVHAVTLTGLGDRAHLGGPDTDVETHVADVVATLRYAEATGVTLVGNSYAGTVVAAAADRAPAAVSTLVYVDTAPLPAGLSTLDFSPPPVQAAIRAQVGDGCQVPLPDRAALPGDGSDLDDATWERFRRLATPHPFGSYTQPVAYSGTAHGHRRVGIACHDGQQILDLARSQPGNPMFADLLSPDWTWCDLDAGHWPMLSVPGDLAALLEKF